MAKIKVMVVDDSVVVRKIVTDVLGEDPGIEIVGTAANGKIAIAKLATLKPDLITLDVEMPEMDGLETLRAIRKTDRKLPIIMFSTLTERGAGATLDALSAGASDYVTKPANVGSVQEAMSRIREQLIPKIKMLCGVTAKPTTPVIAAKPTLAATPRIVSGMPIEIIAIGVSTGGPEALSKLLPQLPKDLPTAVMITQHMPPMFTKMLADRLASQSQLPIREAVHGELVKPGHVLIAPGDYHMTVEKTPRDPSGAIGRVVLNQEAPENSCRPAVDVMFRSIATVYGSRVLGVILTGMGSDGLKGVEKLRAGGASIVVQDEATSVVWGMPGFVAKANLADAVLPLAQIPGELIRRARANRSPLAKAS